MRQKKVFQVIWLVSILVMISLACSLVGGLGKIVGVDPTEISDAATAIEEISTEIESISTEIDIDELITEVGGGDIIETLIPTDMDIFGGDVDPTAKPTDIPVMAGVTLDEASETLVSYSIETELNKIVDFYNAEMPKNGWTKVEAESKVESDTAKLVFTKADRKATVTIEEDIFFGGMVVEIEITKT